uniref:Putative polyprotein n=1 Tax=Albugo laibachii Nc14 TaxID=890382 RepID=F0WSF3_9STRA|nr:putative polyprotein [Albugo laibachii Nc14]|eukprot:CCA24274.1 putative polyprotein [Albugo laibachii Nc14]
MVRVIKVVSSELSRSVNGREAVVDPAEVYYAENPADNIISFGIAEERGLFLEQDGMHRYVVRQTDRQKNFEVFRRINVLTIDVMGGKTKESGARVVISAVLDGCDGTNKAITDTALLELHLRLGILAYDSVERMADSVVSNTRLTDRARPNCLTCAQGKQSIVLSRGSGVISIEITVYCNSGRVTSTERQTTVVTKKPEQKAIGTKWVFTIKRNKDCEVERFKARLVALGYGQTYGIGYTDTYSPVVDLNSILISLAICCHQGLTVHQYDVDTAFLNGYLEEDVFIYPPQGVEGKPNQIFKLNRSLYGIKQAATTWFKTISTVFAQMGFTKCLSDLCMFVRKDSKSWFYVTLYVDDMLIGSRIIDSIKKVASELSYHFSLKIFGKVRFILGIEVEYKQDLRQLNISKEACIQRMVEKFSQVNAKSV